MFIVWKEDQRFINLEKKLTKSRWLFSERNIFILCSGTFIFESVFVMKPSQAIRLDLWPRVKRACLRI